MLQNYSNECGLMFLCRRNLYFSYNTLMINMYFLSLTFQCQPLIAPDTPSQRDWKSNRFSHQTVYLGTVGLDCVVNVDQNQENRHQECHPARNDLRVHQETMKLISRVLWQASIWPYPWDDHKESRGKVICHYVEWHLPREQKLEPGGAVIHSWTETLSAFMKRPRVTLNGDKPYSPTPHSSSCFK